MRRSTFRERGFLILTAALTVAMEISTVLARTFTGQSAADFNTTVDPPLLVKMHHMFWAIPLVVVGLAVSGKCVSYVIWSIAIALAASDLMHHFIVLPLWKGETGWHWP